MSPNRADKSIARSLGEFVGHIVHGIKAKPESKKTVVHRHEVEEEQRGEVTLRRTTIEEVEFKEPEA